MIISASRRTDIPAFYADWFFRRLEEGFVVTRNPFNTKQLSKIHLDNEVVDAIVFWTKDPRPMLDKLELLDKSGIAYYFQFTITPYERDIEPNLPEDKRELIDTFIRLSDSLGPDRVIWRYDPVLFSDKYTLDFHREAYDRCAQLLSGRTKTSVISFLDMDYNNTKKIGNLGIRDGSVEEKIAVATAIAESAAKYGMAVQSCAEDIDLDALGITHGKCIDGDLIELISGKKFAAKRKEKDKTQRQLCGCVASIDIGTYNTCKHGCTYCYANYSSGAIAGNCKQHDPRAAVLIGECDPETIEYRKGQKSFFEQTDVAPIQESLI